MDYKFVQVSVDVATQVILEDDVLDPVDVMDWIASLPQQGYKVSFSYHMEKNSYIVSLSGKDAKNNKGLVLSQWGSTLVKAAQKCFLIHELICKGDNWGMAEGLMEDLLRKALKQNT